MSLNALLEQKVFPKVLKPGRYVGGEMGAQIKPWDLSMIKVAIGYPDLYEVGMSSRGIQIVYQVLNRFPDVLCERFFAPAGDLEQILIDEKIPLFSLETKQSLADFNFLGFSLQHESVYTNFLNVLHLSGIPFTTKERFDKGGFPFVFAGGPAVSNPLPLADFLDFVILGDAEEVLPELIDLYRKEKTANKYEFLKKLTSVPGIYVPSLNNKAQKRTLVLDKFNLSPTEEVIPLVDTVHYRANLEIMRGCPMFCRFCHASYTNKPDRVKKIDALEEEALKLVKESGYGELGLASLSSGDYPGIVDLSKRLSAKLKSTHIKISLPSLRADSMTPELAKVIQENYRSGFTLAPEAGSQRLRNVIRKEITEDDILNAIDFALQARTINFKLYFMIGLPTETDADLQAVIDLSQKIKLKIKHNSRINVTFSFSTFVPKPHTPFQWAGMISEDEIRRKQLFLKQNLTDRQFKMRWHDSRQSIFEGLLTRGDQSLGGVVLKAWQKGCRFDAWGDQFKYELWLEALNECGLSIEKLTRAYDLNEKLPWENIDMGLGVHFLKSEYEQALAAT
jgi:radical SAM family uncharacterized protein